MRRQPYRGDHQPEEAISISVLIVIGVVIVTCSMFIAAVVSRIYDTRVYQTVRTDEEEAFLVDDIPPPYEEAPPAYVAELDAGSDGPPHYQIGIHVKEGGTDKPT